MRVAVIVVAMVAVTTPSEAAQSCMSKTEARQHFGSAHLFWHGPDHCWDATSPRHRQVQVHQGHPVREVRRPSQPKWHDAMSAMLPDEPGQSLRTATALDDERPSDHAVIGMSWADRWVEIGPSQSPLVARPIRVVRLSPQPVNELKFAPMVSTHDVLVLAFIAFVLTLGTVGVLYRQDL